MSAACAGRHFVDQLRDALDRRWGHQVPLHPRLHFLQRIGSLFGVERVEDRHALLVLELLEDVGQVDRMDVGELLLQHVELDVAVEAAHVLRQVLHVGPGMVSSSIFAAIERMKFASFLSPMRRRKPARESRRR